MLGVMIIHFMQLFNPCHISSHHDAIHLILQNLLYKLSTGMHHMLLSSWMHASVTFSEAHVHNTVCCLVIMDQLHFIADNEVGWRCEDD